MWRHGIFFRRGFAFLFAVLERVVFNRSDLLIFYGDFQIFLPAVALGGNIAFGIATVIGDGANRIFVIVDGDLDVKLCA